MSNIDGTDKVEQIEAESLPNPEMAKSPDEFKDSLDANKEHIVKEMHSNNDWNDRAFQIAESKSPSEIKEAMENLGDSKEIEQNYQDAVFGEYDSDAEKQKAIEDAGSAWADNVEKNEVYKMALEKFDMADAGVENDITESAVETESVEPPIIPDSTSSLDQREPVERYHGYEMSPEDKAAYGITPEMEEFVKTGKDFEVLLPSQMEGDDATGMKESENGNANVDALLEKFGIASPDSTNDYVMEIGHNNLSNIEEYRNLEKAETAYGQGIKEATADGIGDGVETWLSGKAAEGSIDDAADKLREWEMAQGHKADYTEQI